jgi:hypothetical protein
MRKGAVAIVHVFKHPKGKQNAPKAETCRNGQAEQVPAAAVESSGSTQSECDEACLMAMQEPGEEIQEVIGVEEPGQSEPSVD